MTTNPLIKLLPHLDRKEMTRFREFAHSPYFNKHTEVRLLIDYLSAIYPKFTEKKCERKVIFRQLYPTLPHDQAKLAIVFTYALRLLEQFLKMEEAKREGILSEDARLLRFLRERGADFYLEKICQENFNGGKFVDKNLSARNSGAANKNYERHIRWAAEMDASTFHLKRYDKDFLVEKQQWLDAQFLSEKLKDACELLQRSKYLKRGFVESPMLRMACEEVQTNESDYLSHPAIIVYFHCYQLLSENEPACYQPALERVESLSEHLPAGSLQNIYNYFQNFCIAQINQGNEEFLRKLFQIYRLQLKRSLLLVNGQLPEWHFKNIVTTGLWLDEHEWVRQFLEEYRTLLSPEVAENAYSYNLAAYYYHLRRFQEVLQLLVQVEYTDLRYNLDAKSLLLRTYYDLDEEEALLALAASFRQFLKRKRSLTDFQKKGYFNLLKFTRKAFRLKMTKGFSNSKKWESDLKKLAAEVEAADTVFNLVWLKGKIDKLG